MTTPNTGWKIEVPGDYFARIAAKEYADDAGMALVREFAQNSADAKASNVAFTFGTENVLTVFDDGKGADAKTIRERILTPLGTLKEEGSVGGFGKAKELLFFGNPSWTIRSRDVRVTGSFLSVTSFETGLPAQAGFTVTVTLPPGLWTAARRAALPFLAASERPGVTWVLDGMAVPVVVTKGRRCVKDFGFAKAYLDKDSKTDSYIYLRTGGLLTSRRYGYQPSEVGRIVIELVGASSELLTPARDWFRSMQHRQTVESWLNALVTDYRRTLAEDVGDEIIFRDLKPVQAKVKAAGVIDREVVPTVGGFKATVEFERPARSLSVDELAAELEDVSRQVQRGDVGLSALAVAEEKLALAKARRRSAVEDFVPAIEGIDSLTVHTGGKETAKAAKKWLAKNADKARKVLAAWATAVRGCSALRGADTDAVGFTFAADAEAEFVRANNGRWALLVNPIAIEKHLGDEWAVEEIVDCAIHELAHQLRGAGHDEAWASTEAEVRRACRSRELRGAVARALRSGNVETVEVL